MGLFEICNMVDEACERAGSSTRNLRHVRRPKRASLLAEEKQQLCPTLHQYDTALYDAFHTQLNFTLSDSITSRHQHYTTELGFPNSFPDNNTASHPSSCCIESEELAYQCFPSMQYSAEDIEMWDLEQILDKSPLSALTADFARFKERFVKMFENGTSGPVYNTDCEDERGSMPRLRAQTISTTKAEHHILPQPPIRSHMDITDSKLPYSTSSNYYPESNSLPRQNRRPTPVNGDLHQPSHLLSDIERVKFYTNLQHGGSLDSLKGNIKPGLFSKDKSVESILDSNRQVERRERYHKVPEKERLHKMKSYPAERPNKMEKAEKLCKVKSTPSINVPAKRPTNLPVIPFVITDEYIYKMKTKGINSADASAKPKDRYHPRLTQSYLAEHHNYNSDYDTASTIQEWQCNKPPQPQPRQQHDVNNETRLSKHTVDNRQRCARQHDIKNHQLQPHTESLQASCNSDYRSTTSHYTNRHDSAFNAGWYDSCAEDYDRCRRGQQVPPRPAAYLTQDNRFLEEDAWGSATASERSGANHNPDKLFNSKTTLGATHRGTHKFIPRHTDEMKIEIGDSIHVINEADDGWCMGINLTTESQGIFPSVYATDLEFYDVNNDTTVKQPTHKQYKLHFLGSMEVNHHKGSDVLVDAIEKVILNRRISKDSTTPPLCQLEVSESGLKMIDLTHKKRTKKLVTDMNIDSACERLSKLLAFSKETKAVSNHFFSLKNVSFCGYHPDNPKYFGFITKHPVQRRFACHCYSSLDESTQPIVDTIGEAFNNYYSDFVPFSDSSEDLYLE